MSAARGIYSKNPINFAKMSHKNPGGGGGGGEPGTI